MKQLTDTCYSRLYRYIYIGIVIIVIISAIGRYRTDEIEYLNSDATWHQMLTIEAYNETPIMQHLFLPIVSLGEVDDKEIPWGETISDSQGNYYYTSFSSVGFLLPWLFFKIFGLPISEESIYIFNNLLFAISACLFVYFLSCVYQHEKNQLFLCTVGAINYLFLPELLHGMGIVYWHQSVLQVTLLFQIIAFYKYAIMKNEKWRIAFYIFSFLNPYIEWTGYVANLGFILAKIIIDRDNKKKIITNTIILGCITIFSFVFFSCHYLLRVDMQDYFLALKNRFMARGVTTNVKLSELVIGYLNSFFYVWVLLAILITVCFWKKKCLYITNGIICLVLAFPIIENIIMKQHAVQYTYDRMKGAWILCFIICEICRNILQNESDRKLYIAIIVLCIYISWLNFNNYKNDTSYVWKVDYKIDNRLLAAAVTEDYPDAIYATNSFVRGYMNMLFGRGVYEYTDINKAIAIAEDRGKNAVVYLEPVGQRFFAIDVFDTTSNEVICYYFDGKIVKNSVVPDGWHLSPVTDSNWTRGVSNESNIILFERNDNLLRELFAHKTISAKDKQYEIVDVEFDLSWIRVQLNEYPLDCMFPVSITIE